MPAFRVIVAGAGVAGLEALLTLADDAGDRAELTLLAPGDAFAERPLAVAEPFALGRPRRRALADVARAAGAALHSGAVAAVDDAAGCLTTHAGAALDFEALLLATGA